MQVTETLNEGLKRGYNITLSGPGMDVYGIWPVGVAVLASPIARRPDWMPTFGGQELGQRDRLPQ